MFLKLWQFLNIPEILFKLSLLSSSKYIDVKEQRLNILDIFFTFLKLKFDKFKFLKFEHPENILDISVTFEVSKFFKSKFFNSEHPENIPDIFVILVVFAFEKFISVIEEHP